MLEKMLETPIPALPAAARWTMTVLPIMARTKSDAIVALPA
jgi:hypothetical protein